MPKVFNEQEKRKITKNLLEECKKSWGKKGYKETKISTLCQNVGISKGAFYIFFNSKESIFYQVFMQIQGQLYQCVERHLSDHQNKNGIMKGLKEIFDVYCSSPFMYDTQSTDFQYFISKLNKQQKDEMQNVTYEHTKHLFQKSFLKFKVDEKLAFSLLTIMLSIISQKEKLQYDEKKVFDFMIDNLINDIFE